MDASGSGTRSHRTASTPTSPRRPDEPIGQVTLIRPREDDGVFSRRDHGEPPSVSAPLISVTGLEKTYVTRARALVPALAGISLDIHAGEFVTIVGQSGCGKTTFLKILAGLIPRSGGFVTLRGEPVNGPSRDIGIVFQDPVLLPWRTVFRNVRLPAEVLGLEPAR